VVALRAGSATDVGLVRNNNQDAYLAANPLYAVADGMGGAAAGEVASATAIEALENGFSRSGAPSPDLLIQAAQAANRAVWDQAETNPEMRGMGTTLVAIALVEGPQLAVINIGDSRLYVLHEGDLRQITSDHNLVAEMVAEGRITPEEAEYHPRRNIMTRALGVEPEVPVDLFLEEAVPGDRYLLCSDGLPREVSDELIASFLRRLADPREAARELVEEAKRKGGNDNITVVVVDVLTDDEAAALGTADGQVGDPASSEAGPGPATPAAAADGDATTALPTAVKEPAAGAEEPVVESPAPRRRTRSPFSLRVVAFILIFLIIIGATAAAIVWYARSAYYVGLRGNQIVVYQGRPGGVLGLDPTLKQTTRYTTADVLASAVPALRSGQEESSVPAAQQYVQRLVQAYDQAQAAAGAAQTTTTGPSTTGPSTTGPSTTGPSNPVPTTAKP
jgi:protein phosphatase